MGTLNRARRSLVVGVLRVWELAGGDLVTESPDFSVSPGLEAPLVTSQSFVLVGLDSTDRIP